MRKQSPPSKDKASLNEFLNKKNPSHNQVIEALKALIRVVAFIIMGKGWKE